jgi:hypothetical protein
MTMKRFAASLVGALILSLVACAYAPAPPIISSPSTNGTTDTDGALQFSWNNAETGGSNECSLVLQGQADSFSSCTSRKYYRDKASGDYVFKVRQIDAAGNVGSAASRTLTVAPPNPFADKNIRWRPTFGVYEQSAAGWVSEPGLLQRQYGDYVGATHEFNYLDLDADNDRYYFCGGRKYEWDDLLVNQNIAPPSRTKAQDPTWFNYAWNGPTGDVIAEYLDNSTAVEQDKALACIFVATTATAQPDPVPNWLERNNSFYGTNLTWTDGQGKVHVRLDKTGGWQAIADLMIALTKRYGDDTRVSSITMGEYYTNPDGGGLPADLDYSLFKSNPKRIWQEWVNAAPRDANNERITLIQSQPITSGPEVEPSDLANIGMGTSGSEAQLFIDGPLSDVRPQLYGVVPNQHQVNAGSVGDLVTWQVPPANPFGFTNGQMASSQYQHIAWYVSNEGPEPLDSIMMGDDCTRLCSQWHTAFQRFGPNGRDAARWGQIPNYPPNQGDGVHDRRARRHSRAQRHSRGGPGWVRP